MRNYKMYKILTQLNSFGNTQISIIKLNENGSFTSFLANESTENYQIYLKWVAEGNTPLPADE